MDNLVKRQCFIDPGYVCLPTLPTKMGVVVASGVVVTVYDRVNRFGGLGHYISPRRKGARSTPVFAAPAIVSLIDMCIKKGSKKQHLEANIVGGAVNPKIDQFEHGVAEENIKVGFEILKKLGVKVAGQDTGGYQARKIVFDSATGDLLVAKTPKVRSSDWYPDPLKKIVR
jgi:chemotaxis protein CheD